MPRRAVTCHISWFIGDSILIVLLCTTVKVSTGNIFFFFLTHFLTTLFTHCSNSSCFVQKFNVDFPRKNVKLFWVKTRENVAVLDFLVIDNFDFTREYCREKNWVKNSWKCWGFALFSCWQLWFHEKNCQKKFGWKTRETVGYLHFLFVDNFDFPRKL